MSDENNKVVKTQDGAIPQRINSDLLIKGQNPQATHLHGGVMPQPFGDIITEGANPQIVSQPRVNPQGGVQPQVIPTTLSGGGKPPAHE